MSQLSTLQSDGIQRLALSDIAEPHSGSASGPRTTGQLRLPYHLVEPIAFTVDIILVVAISLLAGIGYNYFFLGLLPAANAIQVDAAIGVLTLTNVCAILAARGDYRVSNLVNFYRQARDLTIIWAGVLLCPLLMLLLAGTLGWLLIHKLLVRPHGRAPVEQQTPAL